MGRETNHGFTLSNERTDEVVVVVTFTATAQGVLRLSALANLRSITSTPDAQYPVSNPAYVVDGKTYQTMWEAANQIHVERAASRFSASRDGTATFVLPPGSSVTIGQVNTNVVGEGRVTGRIQSINGIVDNASSMAIFGFELGGQCISV